MKILMNHRLALTTGLGAVLLAACGGGDSGPAAVPTATGSDIPASATTSSGGAFTYVNGLRANLDETASPITVGDVTLGASETEEPDPSV